MESNQVFITQLGQRMGKMKHFWRRQMMISRMILACARKCAGAKRNNCAVAPCLSTLILFSWLWGAAVKTSLFTLTMMYSSGLVPSLRTPADQSWTSLDFSLLILQGESTPTPLAANCIMILSSKITLGRTDLTIGSFY